jgi:low molecular weight phosphotyrosine protein phosphatase
MAELVMRETARAAGVLDEWEIDSCGTAAYHIGDPPDSRGVATCRRHYGEALEVPHRARQLCAADFARFEHVFVMDESNLRDAKRVASSAKAAARTQPRLLGELDPEGERIIEDPYYGGDDGFEHNFRQVERCCKALLEI